MAHFTPKLNIALIFLLIITLIGGSYMVVCYIGGVEFTAYRFVLIISAIYLLITRQLKCYTNSFSKYVFFVFLFWFAYGIASLIWAPSLLYAMKELFYLWIGFTTYIVFFSFLNSEKNFELALEKIWTVSFIVVVSFLLFECFTQRHLEGEYLQKLAELGAFHKVNFIPIFTFVNQNVLAIYLCVSIVLAVYYFIRNRNKLLNSVIILFAIDFLLLTESRLGIMCIGAIVVASLVLLFFKSVRTQMPLSLDKKQVFVIAVFIGLNFLVVHYELRLLESNTEFKSLGSKTDTEESLRIRKKLDKRILEDGRILLLSDANEKAVKALPNPDRMFAIEESAYIKLLDGERVRLKLKEIDSNLQQSIFIGKNKVLIGLFVILFIGLATCYFAAFQFKKTDIVMILSCIALFMIALVPWHPFKYPSDHYKKLVLTESGFDVLQISSDRVGIISVVALTGNLLEKGGETETFLYSDRNLPQERRFIYEKLSSNTIRKNLVLNGLEYLKSSHYMGLGAGGFQVCNMKKMNKYPDDGVGGAHNFVIEILSQYGIIVFLLLLSIFSWIGIEFIRALRTKRWSEKHFLVLWLFITLIFMGNSNSTFLSLPINWFLMVVLLIFANDLKKPKKVSNEENKL
ncbi:O-antigen ligase family protein [Fluviicola sp.]|uniref:O-antigen ligase family protein n=1 Tax=Fluviicola sp. TaxID=1917219 RepID=UPI003D2DBE19